MRLFLVFFLVSATVLLSVASSASTPVRIKAGDIASINEEVEYKLKKSNSSDVVGGDLVITINVVLRGEASRTYSWSKHRYISASSIDEAKAGNYMEHNVKVTSPTIRSQAHALLDHLQNVKEGDILVRGESSQSPICAKEALDLFFESDNAHISMWEAKWIAVACP